MMYSPGPYPAVNAQMAHAAAAPKRNLALLITGAALVFFSLLPGALFAMNLYQYATVEDRWAEDGQLGPEAREFGVRVVQEAAMRRMVLFGPVSAVIGLGGLVMFGLGLRKK